VLAQQFPLRLMLCRLAKRFNSCRWQLEAYWLPRSLRHNKPLSGFRFPIAISKASLISVARMSPSIDQSTTCREKQINNDRPIPPAFLGVEGGNIARIDLVGFVGFPLKLGQN